jgi:hypothetical protein
MIKLKLSNRLTCNIFNKIKLDSISIKSQLQIKNNN